MCRGLHSWERAADAPPPLAGRASRRVTTTAFRRSLLARRVRRDYAATAGSLPTLKITTLTDVRRAAKLASRVAGFRDLGRGAVRGACGNATKITDLR